MGSLPMLVMFVALLGMWFFMSRTQKKQQQERQNLLDSMKAGDEVVTIGGLHGVVSEIDETNRTVVLDCEAYLFRIRSSSHQNGKTRYRRDDEHTNRTSRRTDRTRSN